MNSCRVIEIACSFGAIRMATRTHHPIPLSAYEVLADRDQRRIYDVYGEEGLEQARLSRRDRKADRRDNAASPRWSSFM